MATPNEVEQREDELWSPPRRVVFVTIEGLGTNLVGAFGNAICPTPNWDAFAVNSITGDSFWMDSTSTYEILQSICTGRHQVTRRRGAIEGGRTADPSHSWEGSGIETPGLFVTDDPEACKVAKQFLDGVPVCVSRENSVNEETDFEFLLTKSFELWTERLETLPWIWIHSKGLAGPWDAPLEYRSRMCDEGDPAPPTSRVPPVLWLEDDPDPDIAFGWSCGAGAQAISMDESWAWIDRFLREMALLDHCLVILAGVQGFPLGEHRRIGLVDASKQNHTHEHGEQQDAPESERGACYAERLHTPLLMRPGNVLPLGWRMPQCIQPHQIHEWIEAWMSDDPYVVSTLQQHGASRLQEDRASDAAQGESNAESAWSKLLARWDPSIARNAWEPAQRSALAIGSQDVALIVPSWSSRWIGGESSTRGRRQHESEHEDRTESAFPSSSGGVEEECWIPTSSSAPVPLSRVELYVHPEDRWQQNEVGDRAAAILEYLVPILNAWTKMPEVGPKELERLLWELDPSLLDPVR